MYCVNPHVDEPIMLIDRHIGFDETDGAGIIGADFSRELLQLDSMGKKRIQVWINSPGGSVLDGYDIFNAILKSNTPVDTYCNGMAASIAGVIFQAGRKRYIADYGVLMYHNPWGGDNTKALDAMRESLITMVSAKSGMDRTETELMMNRETFVEASEAIKKGLADVIEHSVSLNKKWVRPTEQRAAWKEYGKILNSTLTKYRTMKAVANRLKLNDEASESAIVEAINALENRANLAEVANKKSEDEMAKMKADMEEAENNFKAKQAEYEKCKADLDEANNKLATAADEAATVKASALVDTYVKAGRIKNDAGLVGTWVTKAKADFEGTKALLESIPVNAKAVKFDIKDSGKKEQAEKFPTVAMQMAEIENRLHTRK